MSAHDVHAVVVDGVEAVRVGEMAVPAPMLAERTITARVAEVIPLIRSREAYEAMARGGAGGKRLLDLAR